ncbi:MAG TPA: hypothetical protein PKZ36_01370 [Candidatus Paceibacterota bacterium]|nr:hypothetical protein [Candidatus Paceibacterota bacterium]HPT18036.1 hypothetical protein [Candidatus Paceibacterota bacterium]
MDNEDKIKKIEIETFADDMAKALRDSQNGSIKQIIEEQENRDEEAEELSPENKKNKILMIVGTILVFLSVIAIVIVFLFKKQIFTVEVTPQYVPIIFTDKTEFKEVSELNREQIINTISNEVNMSEFKAGGVEAIYLTKNNAVLGFRDFLKLSEFNLDSGKIEFIKDNFLMGVSNNQAKNLFFLIKMRSIADVFDVMHSWEDKMFYDLHSFFGINLNANTKYLLEKKFEDGIVQNKNARVLYDNEGNIVLMYVFVENDSLVITNNENTVKELILRLASSKVKK